MDRQGDTVNVDGWHTRGYLKNPVVLWGHDYSIPPIGKATAIWKQDGALKATVQFRLLGLRAACEVLGSGEDAVGYLGRLPTAQSMSANEPKRTRLLLGYSAIIQTALRWAR